MAILKMKKLRICGVSEEQTQLIRQLQLLGSVEIGAPCALTDTQGVQVFCAGDGKSADALLRTSARLTSALETLKHYETKKGGLFAARPEKTIGELFSVADADLLMPPKSTWFEPKLRSGLFIHIIER